MTLSDLLSRDSVLVPLNAATGAEAVSSLVEALKLPWSAKDKEEFKASVLAREAAGSTGLGNGVAIPHARSPRLTSARLAAGLAPAPVEFNAADGKPVSLFFLLAVPAADPAAHLKVLAALSRALSDKKLLRGLMKAASADALYALVAGVPV